MNHLQGNSRSSGYELRFPSLRVTGRGCSFPCDANGQVDLDALSAADRNSYFYARAVLGAEFARPTVLARQ